MSQKKLLAKWKANRSVKDARYAEATAMLIHHGFEHVKKTTHTHWWTHELLADMEEMLPGGMFSLTERHAPGKIVPLYSSDVRLVVKVIGLAEQERRRRKEVQQALAGGEVPMLAHEMIEEVDAEEVSEDDL